jgi:hypothetical protein
VKPSGEPGVLHVHPLKSKGSGLGAQALRSRREWTRQTHRAQVLQLVLSSFSGRGLVSDVELRCSMPSADVACDK